MSRDVFRADDLRLLDETFLARAKRVVAMEDVYAGDKGANVIGLRHDCDSGGSLATAVEMARWELEHGYRSTYYVLHTSPYWDAPDFEDMLEQIAGYGHEIGIHTDALAESFVTGEDPDLILERAIKRLRNLGYRVRGVAGHGNAICNRDAGPGEEWFANDEQFVECRRTYLGGKPMGSATRSITRGNITRNLAPRPLADFGLEYEALWLSVPFYFRLSDSGGRWNDEGFTEIADTFAAQLDVDAPATGKSHPRQLHILQHPDWWARAFTELRQLA